jgi:hypothetical protein
MCRAEYLDLEERKEWEIEDSIKEHHNCGFHQILLE